MDKIVGLMVEMNLRLIRKIIWLGLCFTLALSLDMTSNVKAQNTQTICRQVVEATAKELGGIDGYGDAFEGGWWYEDIETGLNIRIQAFNTIDAAKIQWGEPPVICGPEGERLSRTPDNFRGYRARWDGKGCGWSENPDTGDIWGYEEQGELFSWQQDRFILSIGYGRSTWDTPVSRKTVKEQAQILYANAEEYGLFESQLNPIRGTAYMVEAKYPDGSSETITEEDFVLTEGTTFTLSDPDNSWIMLPGQVVAGKGEVTIQDVTDNEEEYRIDIIVEPFGGYIMNVYTPQGKEVFTECDIKGGGICQSHIDIPKTIKEKGPATILTFGINTIVKWETGVPYVATGARIGYWALEQLVEKSTGKDSGNIGPIILGENQIMAMTPNGQVVPKSDGIIEVSDYGTTVYVFEGMFEVSNIDKTKTVTVYSGQTSNIPLQGEPSDPELFDPNSIDRWWEAVPKSTPAVETNFIEGPVQNWIDDEENASEKIDVAIGDAKTWYNKGVAFDNSYMYEEAIECYDKAIEIDPQYAKALNNKGADLLSLGSLDDAIECFEQAVDIDPYYAEAWNNKGVALGRMGEFEDAIGCFEKAIEIDTFYREAWNNIGNAHYYLGNYHDAVYSYDMATTIDITDATAWNNKGKALQKLGRIREAQEAYNKAAELEGRG